MTDVGCVTEGPQQSPAADAERQFLPQAHLRVPAVEFGRDAPVVGRVGGVVCVEQKQRDRTDARTPRAQQHVAAGQRNGDAGGRAVRAGHAFERQDIRVDERMVLALRPRLVEVLPKIAAGIQEPYGNDRDAELAGRLQVIAREDPEAARVDREHLREPELHAEVRDGTQLAAGAGRRKPAWRGIERGAGGHDLVQQGAEANVARERRPALRCRRRQHQLRVAGALPHGRVDRAPQRVRRVQPGPAQVQCETDQRSKRRIERGGTIVNTRRPKRRRIQFSRHTAP